MRDKWNANDIVELNRDQLQALIQPVFGEQQIEDFWATEGGLANTNVRIKIAGQEKQFIIRVYTRDRNQAKKEFAISRLVENTVPSPRYLYLGDSNPVTDHPYAIREWIDGERMESIFGQLAESELTDIGDSIGNALAAIHAHKFLHAGFFDDDLNVANQISLGGAGLIDYANDCLRYDIARERLGDTIASRLVLFLTDNAGLLDEWDGAPCLTHSDFGGSNILVSKHSGKWAVTGILDWEFALSGSPFFDFGNLLREPVGSSSPFVSALKSSYEVGGGLLPAEWRKMSLLTDLTAWLEFLTRPNINQSLIEDAQQVIGKTIAEW